MLDWGVNSLVLFRKSRWVFLLYLHRLQEFSQLFRFINQIVENMFLWDFLHGCMNFADSKCFIRWNIYLLATTAALLVTYLGLVSASWIIARGPWGESCSDFEKMIITILCITNFWPILKLWFEICFTFFSSFVYCITSCISLLENPEMSYAHISREWRNEYNYCLNPYLTFCQTWKSSFIYFRLFWTTLDSRNI